MKNYIDIEDVSELSELVQLASELKKKSLAYNNLGKDKTLGMLFFNPSLRTRLSTQKAATNLGMHVMVMNFGAEGWSLEFEDGAVMNGSKSEHIKEAAQVVSQYCDVLAVRAFAKLENKKDDYAENVINGFVKYASIPIVNMESATAHPLQALTDCITINEYKTVEKPKVVLSWAPHPKALPQAVANSFVRYMKASKVDLVIACPKGYELDEKITKGVSIINNQAAAFKNADFIYTKNWSAVNDYGKILPQQEDWMITSDKMELTANAKFMHCLPVRRNVVVSDEVLDSKNSLVIQQANNRTYAAQAVLKSILENINS
jgi:N-succinyl-L-ornithine transcarbamylase